MVEIICMFAKWWPEDFIYIDLSISIWIHENFISHKTMITCFEPEDFRNWTHVHMSTLSWTYKPVDLYDTLIQFLPSKKQMLIKLDFQEEDNREILVTREMIAKVIILFLGHISDSMKSEFVAITSGAMRLPQRSIWLSKNHMATRS